MRAKVKVTYIVVDFLSFVVHDFECLYAGSSNEDDVRFKIRRLDELEGLKLQH